MSLESDARYYARENEACRRLAPLLTDEWIRTLVLAARVSGGPDDVIELRKFVEWCCEVAGVECPEYSSYDYTDGGSWEMECGGAP